MSQDTSSSPDTVTSLCEDARSGVAQLQDDMHTCMVSEVDANQAEMFVRRFNSSLKVIDALAGQYPEGELLLLGLIRRLQEVIHGKAPRTQRVRAVIDYFYSKAALLHHTRLPSHTAVTIEQLVEAAAWDNLRTGLSHKLITGVTPDSGPVHINAMCVDPHHLRLAAHDMRALAQPFTAGLAELGAIAGVSGGFFLYSEPNIEPPSQQGDPVGALVCEGRVCNPPVFSRATLLQDAGGNVEIRRFGMEGVGLSVGGDRTLVISGVNCPSQQASRTVAWNRAHSETSPEHSSLVFAVIGSKVIRVAVDGASIPIPLNGFVVTTPSDKAQSWSQVIQVGSLIEYTLPLSAKGERYIAAMAGGPMLLNPDSSVMDYPTEHFAETAPPVTFSQDETFDHNLLPRMGVGLTPTGSVIFAAIDGRNFDSATGMTLRSTAQLLHSLGCTTAMNLDGGSSKRMVIEGKVLDLASTEVVSGASDAGLVRAVHSAVVITAVE